MRSACRFAIVSIVACLGGCQRGGEPLVLQPEAFLRESTLEKPETSGRRTAIDQPGIVNYDNVRVDLLRPEEEAPAGNSGDPVTVPQSVAALVPSPSTTAPPLPPLGTGTAAVLGRVVVEVNGEPIFSRKVLQPIEPDLAARAREMDPESFRKAAARAIREQIDFLIRTELEVAAARKNLSAQDLLVADALTEQWRRKQVTEAGGSLEEARRKARAEGTTFEEKVMDEYRANLVRIYYSKKIFPRVQVSADEMRRFYDRNRQTLFTERAAAQFRLIKVDVKKVGSAPMALAKAEELRDRARRGEDFETLAREYNDDSRLRSNGGDVGMIDRGAFARQKVEEAVWALSPGQITDVIEDSGAYYIARLEQKKEGRERSFEEEAVQDQIRRELSSRQLTEMRERRREELLQNAVVNPYPPPIEPLVEIVMQKYPYWAMKTDG
ncbi:MAG: peptidylprolyl isomerase [Phycisphaerae bacterium]|nr:peptidylprolyl isomerase [Phycisphaerae bacterium]MDW8261620.1 peptidylprolyl isomerase [Phycisphaerales bacterium]